MDRTEELRASPPMFNSALLDRFTRVHPAVPVLIYAPVIAVLLLTGEQRVGLANSFGLMLGGYAVWTLTEYWLHRVVFHFEPQKGLGARLHWMIHGVHHDHPNDPLRLVMPPSASVPLATAFCLVFWLVLGSDHAPAFSAGFLAGYLAYDMVHYHVHHHRPRTRVGRRLRELHMRHHFQDDERGFGVSAPYWDRVFGTAPGARRSASVGPVRHAVPSVTDEHDTQLSPEDEEVERSRSSTACPSSRTTRGCWSTASTPRCPARQAAALAATGFAAGAVTAAVVTRRRATRPARKQAQEGRGGGDRLEQLVPRRRPPAAPRLSLALG